VNLAQMFDGGRFDAMIVLDKPAIEKILKEKNIAYAWADYKVPLKLGVFFRYGQDFETCGRRQTLV